MESVVTLWSFRRISDPIFRAIDGIGCFGPHHERIYESFSASVRGDTVANFFAEVNRRPFTRC